MTVIDELMLCKEPATSPAGGYTFFKLTAEEIKKKLL